METTKTMIEKLDRGRLWLPLLACVPLACAPPDGPGHETDPSEHDEHDEEEGGVIELTEMQLAAAAIEVVTAGPGEIIASRTLPAVVAVNADAITHVTPRVPGLVHSIHRHLGEEVASGDLLCVVESAELGQTVADLLRADAMAKAAEETLELEGALFSTRIETAERVLDGAIAVNQRIYEREQELQAKAVSTIRPLLEAERDLEMVKLGKEERMSELRAARDARLLSLRVALREKRILADAARNVLVASGVDVELADEIPTDSPLISGRYEIRAARKGIVSGRHITVGEHVDPEAELFTIQDLSRVWIEASAFEDEIREIGTGQRAVVTLDAFPDRSFAGEVAVIGVEVNPQSRALMVRVELNNAEIGDWSERYPLRPGMFGRVELETDRRVAPIVLPESALVHGKAGEYVFVQVGDGAFEERPVRVGIQGESTVEILSGVGVGEEVAATQTFLLKSIARRGELGEGHEH